MLLVEHLESLSPHHLHQIRIDSHRNILIVAIHLDFDLRELIRDFISLLANFDRGVAVLELVALHGDLVLVDIQEMQLSDGDASYDFVLVPEAHPLLCVAKELGIEGFRDTPGSSLVADVDEKRYFCSGLEAIPRILDIDLIEIADP